MEGNQKVLAYQRAKSHLEEKTGRRLTLGCMASRTIRSLVAYSKASFARLTWDKRKRCRESSIVIRSGVIRKVDELGLLEAIQILDPVVWRVSVPVSCVTRG